jgi:hypothetical protein
MESRLKLREQGLCAYGLLFGPQQRSRVDLYRVNHGR